jgi:hypothetical protein
VKFINPWGSGVKLRMALRGRFFKQNYLSELAKPAFSELVCVIFFSSTGDPKPE